MDTKMDTHPMSRLEHLAWCKQRAEAYLARGDWQNAMGSFLSDLRKHPEQSPAVGELGALLLFAGHINSVPTAREFINGTN